MRNSSGRICYPMFPICKRKTVRSDRDLIYNELRFIIRCYYSMYFYSIFHSVPFTVSTIAKISNFALICVTQLY